MHHAINLVLFGRRVRYRKVIAVASQFWSTIQFPELSWLQSVGHHAAATAEQGQTEQTAYCGLYPFARRE